jgi:hypothetical protein
MALAFLHCRGSYREAAGDSLGQPVLILRNLGIQTGDRILKRKQ